MRELTNEKFWRTDIEKIRTILLSSSTEAYDALVVLEFIGFDIELTDLGFTATRRDFDYYCCKNGR